MADIETKALRRAEGRFGQELVKLLFDGARVDIIDGPVWALALAIILSVIVPVLGSAPIWLAALWVAAQTAWSFIAHAVRRTYLANPAALTPRAWLRVLGGLYLLNGLTWVQYVVSFWEPGHLENNMFIVVTLLGMFVSVVMNHARHVAIVAAIIVPPALAVTVVGVLADGVVAGIMGWLSLPFVGWILIVGRSVQKRQDETLQIRLRNEEMASQLASAHREALRAKLAAEGSNRAKSAFLATMSHELRTPLNAILGFSEVIAQESFGPVGSERYRDYAGDIHRSGAHLLQIINDVLDISKIEAGKFELVFERLPLRPVAEDALRIIAPTASAKGVAVADAEIAGDVELVADERALRQILLNLLSNAIKFTPAGGRVGVRARRAAGGMVALSVFDEGCGIAADDLARVFEPFEQVGNPYTRPEGGTGLGLTIVRALAQLHGGDAAIESEVGRGTVVTMTFPLEGPADQAEAA